MRILIAGCGYVGSVLASELVAEGHEVVGLRRDPSGLPDGVKPLSADLLDLDSLNVVPERIDYVVYAAAPGARGQDEDGMRRAYRSIYLDGFDNLLRVLAEREFIAGDRYTIADITAPEAT